VYEKRFLGMQEARAAVDAVLVKASEDPQHPVVVAVVDPEGELVAFARMDGAGYLPRSMALRKAYTAARMGSDSGAFGDRMGGVVSSLNGLGDPLLVGFKGAVCIRSGTAVIGAIGVSGRTADDDEDLARVGLAALSE
jgi:glc operon protein GlcG